MSATPSHHGIFGHRQSAAGFSLLEVLIALVILSVGLLGIAAMISSTVKSNDSAYMRTQATALAYSIIDRMRTNQLAAQNGQYNIALGTAAPGSATICNGTGANCSSTTLAAFDLAQWKQALASSTNGLPGGDGSIVTAAVGGVTTVTVTVQWIDSRAYAALKKSSAPTVTTFSLAVSSVL
ncbi:MAG: type IV pilus modification protein PilV [Gammaproteobacteria bacterium]|nr:type IV pilus modification protein PilV [Gammaproteobacteria bacterium]